MAANPPNSAPHIEPPTHAYRSICARSPGTPTNVVRKEFGFSDANAIPLKPPTIHNANMPATMNPSHRNPSAKLHVALEIMPIDVVRITEKNNPTAVPSKAPCMMLVNQTFVTLCQPITLMKYVGLTAPFTALVRTPSTAPEKTATTAIPTRAIGLNGRVREGLAYSRGCVFSLHIGESSRTS